MKSTHWLILLIVVLLTVMSAQTWLLWKMHNEHKTEVRSEDVYRPTAPSQRNAYPARQMNPSQFQWSFGQNSSRPLQGMNTNIWDPLQEMDDMQNMMNRMFRNSFNRGAMMQGLSGTHASTFDPEIDIQSKDDEYLVTVDLPGIEKDKIDVKVKDGQLILSGQREAQKETDHDDGFYQMERSFGSFYRTFPLPQDASSDGIKAESKNGVLTIHVPRLKGGKKTESSINIE